MDAWEAKHQAKLPIWKARIAECRSSGISVRQWCLEHSISPTTYYRWEREALSRIKELEPAAVGRVQTLTEATMMPMFAELPAEAAQACLSRKSLCLRSSGYELEIPAGTDPDIIGTIIRAMRHAE